jgi:hypothetical protein
MATRTSASMPVKAWIKNICATQVPKLISCTPNQKIPSMRGTEVVERAKSIIERIARK